MIYGPRVLTVSRGGNADFSSIYQALLESAEGDVVFVNDGEYSPALTGEVFPLFVPTGVQLLGSGPSTCRIVGDDSLLTSNRPLDPYQSMMLLGHDSVLSGFTLENSGANAVSHLQDANFLIEKNVIQHNGQHGVLLYGPRQATIRNNEFYDNGTKHYEPPPPPLPAPCRQGHHIYFEGKSSTSNCASILSNKMIKTFADGIALAPVFDERSNVEMTVQIIDNDIHDAQRSGIGIGGSFGTCDARVTVDIRNNRLVNNQQNGIDAVAALSLIPRLVKNVQLSIRIVGNEVSGSPKGINNIAAFGPAKDVLMESWILNNHVSDYSTHGIRAVGGISSSGRPANNNVLCTVIANNTIDVSDGNAVVVQGAAFGEPRATPPGSSHEIDPLLSDNEVVLALKENALPDTAITIDNGSTGNVVTIERPS